MRASRRPCLVSAKVFVSPTNSDNPSASGGSQASAYRKDAQAAVSPALVREVTSAAASLGHIALGALGNLARSMVRQPTLGGFPMETESSSIQSLTEDFQAAARAIGITGQTISRMSLSPERALACVHEANKRGAGAGLAVHIFDAGDWPQKPKERGTNLAVESKCAQCGGDRFVVVNTRQPVQSSWMAERGIQPTSEAIEEYAPCKSCNASADTSFYRADGTRVSTAPR